jgi:diacylglycerol kinase family enzyme
MLLPERKKENVSSLSTASRNHEQKLNKKLKHDDILLVANPTSSGGATGKDWENFYTKIKETFGGNPHVVFTKKAGDGTALTRKFLKKGFKRVIAIGGDGTINEVANGFFSTYEYKEDKTSILHFPKNNGGKQNRSSNNDNNNIDNVFPQPDTLKPINSEAMMGLIPSGSRNVLAKSLNLPQGISECCHNYKQDKVQKLDILTATVTNPSTHSKVPTRVFLNAAELGFGAEIIDRSKKVRSKVNSRLISTITGVIATLPTYESNNCEILFDDGRERVITKMTMGVIANSKFLGGGFMVAPEASFTDGLLDVIILRDSGSLKMLDRLANIKTGDYTDEVNVFYKQAKKVSIMSKEREVTVAIDGEPIGILPATFQVNRNPLNVIL